jgi:hypothetical protein
MEWQNIDVDVTARHEHVCTADERRAHYAVGHDVDLPDRRKIEDVTLDDDVADHKHREENEEGGNHAGYTRQEGNSPNVCVHGPGFFILSWRSERCAAQARRKMAGE